MIGTRSECDRLSCEYEKHSLEFDVYYHKVNNEYFYCLNRKQLGQYCQCVTKMCILFVLKDVKNAVFVRKWQIFSADYKIVSCFIQNRVLQKTLIKFHINQFCGVYLIVWMIKKKKIRIEIRKLIPHAGLVLDYGKTRWSCIYSFFCSDNIILIKEIIIDFVVFLIVNVLIVFLMKCTDGVFKI